MNLLKIFKTVSALCLIVLLASCIISNNNQNSKNSMKKALFIIAQKDFQDQEFSDPYQKLQEKGVKVIIASKEAGKAIGKFGKEIKAEIAINKVKAIDYDVIIFIGGPGAVSYQQDADAHRIAREAVENGKILAAICIAPTILAEAGVLDGVSATCWNGDGGPGMLLQERGVNFTNEEVTVDGNIITANGPSTAEKFANNILEKLF